MFNQVISNPINKVETNNQINSLKLNELFYKDLYKYANPDFKNPPLPGHIKDFYEEIPKFIHDTSILKTNPLNKIKPQTCLFGDLGDMIQDLDYKMVLGFLENITEFGPRVTSSTMCDDAGRYIYQEFEKMGLEVRFHNWTLNSYLHGSNIEATLTGVDPLSDEIYIICGHYDSVSGSPGADDNAAGTTAVMSAAKVMSKYHFDHTVRFIAFSGEEQGLHGSQFYAKEAYENGDNIVAVLNADMMGYSKNQEGEKKVIVYESETSEWIKLFSIDISEQYYDLIHLEIVDGGYSGRSDHASFLSYGYDAIFYFEYDINPNYHSKQDIIKNMNVNYATNVSKLMLATLAELSHKVGYLPPLKPEIPSGPLSGRAGDDYTYESSSIDPDGDQIYYMFEWGDGTDSDWLGPYESGDTCSEVHNWEEQGTYEIRVKVKDSYNLESDWSDPLQVNMPKSKQIDIINQRFIRDNQFLLKLFEIFHNLFE